ncbi:hypothetical protein [Alkalihalobacillus sp. BA299]|uniref:hypothetical protein n=1 Tax=Alkalihalobacillus sp. BA299 TaxID=2815938 RepID=UPI001ADAC662|nr:hypothetical protein [Alkalihalobacillus sp. BA299]
MENLKYWLVVYQMKTGDFKNATMLAESSDDTEKVSEKFENEFSDYRVIHIGEGEFPPKTYRSLEYI